LDAETGALLWQHTGTPADGIFVRKDSVFVVEENGVKEFAVAKIPATVTDLEVLTELANAFASRGSKSDLEEALALLDRAGRIDPDFPPLRLGRSRLLHSGAELATYANLAGRNSL